jgi:hypothetical protein
MAEVQTLKAEKDFSKEVDKLIPEAESLAKVCNPLQKSKPLTSIDKPLRCRRKAPGGGEASETGKLPKCRLHIADLQGIRSTLDFSHPRLHRHDM